MKVSLHGADQMLRLTRNVLRRGGQSAEYKSQGRVSENFHQVKIDFN